MVGVDAENHSLNSYEGFLCLIQLSVYPVVHQCAPITFLVDVLAPEVRQNFKQTIGEVFENPSVIKLLHGCISSDVVWLMRDFGVMINGVFDTQDFQTGILSLKQNLGLANFWLQYCKGLNHIPVEDKHQYQVSDWSVRPLPARQLEYAANDTYFLYHIAR